MAEIVETINDQGNWWRFPPQRPTLPGCAPSERGSPWRVSPSAFRTGCARLCGGGAPCCPSHSTCDRL